MKALFLCLLFSCAVGAAALAQQSPVATTQQQAPSDVTVVKYSWSKERINWEGNPFGGTVESFEDVRRRMVDQRRLERARASGQIAEAGKIEREMRSEQVIKARPTAPPRYIFLYKLWVENTGAKAIKEIDWDYVFTDAATGLELSRREFTAVEKVSPGKSKELAFTVTAPPTNKISVHALDKRERDGLRESVTLVRVLYADGTVWQRP